MSKRTLRRAAERQARKAERTQQLTAQAAVATAPAMPFEPEAESEDLTLSPDVQLPVEPPTASAAQIAANRENAQLSCGPVTTEGKFIVSQNRRAHGLTGRFVLLSSESVADYDSLVESVYAEHKPEGDTEYRLANSLIQHYWLMQRAILLQEQLVSQAPDPTEADSKKLSLFLRYQATHERSYYKAQRELQNLQKQKRKGEIGFESQKRQEEAHEAKVRLTHARAQNLEIDTACRQTMEAPIPGNTRIPFEKLTKACSTAIATVVYENQAKGAA